MEEYNNVQRLGESRNDIYWILYQTINLQNNKIYIGVHKTKILMNLMAILVVEFI